MMERADELWDICLVLKKELDGAYWKAGCRNFVKKSVYRMFLSLAVYG